MSETAPTITRDAERSRAAILDAAEALFAEKGYAATSLREIGERAGVSRGTPSYFFGSKEGLYRAVFERVFADVHELLSNPEAFAAALRGGGPDEVIAAGIAIYFDFLVARPTFVRLLQREALDGGHYVTMLPEHVASVQGALAVLAHTLTQSDYREVDPAQLLLSIMSLAWFPLAQAETLLPVLGFHAGDPDFIEQRKRHMIDLVLNGIRRRDSDADTPARNAP